MTKESKKSKKVSPKMTPKLVKLAERVVEKAKILCLAVDVSRRKNGGTQSNLCDVRDAQLDLEDDLASMLSSRELLA